jgi:hypothetical protein
MGRRRSEPKPTALSPIPDELAALIDDTGHYRRKGFVPGERDEDWETYKRLKIDYCARAGIRPADFRRSVIRCSTPSAVKDNS